MPLLFLYSCGKTSGNAPQTLSSESNLPSSAIVYGKVTDSLTGNPLANVSIAIKSGTNVISTVNSDSSGQYSFAEITNGNYTISFQLANYVSVDAVPFVLAGVAFNINKSMSPPTLSGQMRIVLSWYAENPLVPNIANDLDAYFLNLTENSFTNYTNTSQNWLDGSSATLDNDSVNYSGPETITISNINSTSNYTFYVHNFSNYSDCNSLAASGVHVDVYSGGTLIKSYDIPVAPNGGGAVYEFFNIQNGVIVDKKIYNESLPIDPASSTPAFCTR